jgi:hypothetical protein
MQFSGKAAEDRGLIMHARAKQKRITLVIAHWDKRKQRVVATATNALAESGIETRDRHRAR